MTSMAHGLWLRRIERARTQGLFKQIVVVSPSTVVGAAVDAISMSSGAKLEQVRGGVFLL